MDSNCITTRGSFQSQTTTSSIARNQEAEKCEITQREITDSSHTCDYNLLRNCIATSRVVVDDITNEMPV